VDYRKRLFDPIHFLIYKNYKASSQGRIRKPRYVQIPTVAGYKDFKRFPHHTIWYDPFVLAFGFMLKGRVSL
jgi:hypothetical protein